MPFPPRPDPRTPAVTPSTTLILVRGGLRVLLFTGLLWLISLVRKDGLGLGWAVITGVIWGYWDVVSTYRRPDWRAAVAPEQMLGLGLAGLIAVAALFGAMILGQQKPLPWFVFAVPLLLVLLPVTLMRTAWRELRRRRNEAT